MIHRLSLIVFLLALIAASPARAQDDSIITNVWASTEECPAETAKKVSFDKLAADPGAYAGRCVRVEGLWLGGRAFYSDLRGFYAVGPKLADLPKDKRVHRIGLYAKPGVLDPGDGFSAAEVTITGIAGTCRGLHGGHTVTVMGYCHYTGGPILKVASMTAEPRPYTRFIGAGKRKAFGNLDFAPERWPHREVVEARAEEWRALIQKRRYKDFAVLNGIDPADMDLDEARIMQTALKDDSAPFADFHRVLDARPLAILIEKDPWQDDESDPRDYTAIACYCRTTDKAGGCDGRWPISDFDAPSADGRPYICVRLWQYFESGLAHIGLETLVGPEDFTEKTKK